MRVGVLGAGGRMGATVCAAVAADPELDLVAAVDPKATGHVEGVEIAPSIEALFAADAEVAVDFTEATARRARTCAGWPSRASTPWSAPRA